MKKILIIYPHFPPSNLAGVHRPRLFAQHLSSFGWEPVILTVHENYYEETLDYNLEKLLPVNLRIIKVKAFKITKPRLIGDIGIRAFFQLYKKAKELISLETINFLYIPIPSFYCALLGRWLHHSTGIRYGIDYIDPWVHHFPGSDKLFSRHWFSSKFASKLEKIAIKKAVLITGVAEGYYEGVVKRNPHLQKQAALSAMPYGGELLDHEKIIALNIQPYLFQKKNGKVQLVYAGAMLPKAYDVLEAIFKSMNAASHLFADTELHFIGTGSRVNDPTSYNIKPLAEKYGLWNIIVFEYPQRIPYLDVLVHLNTADGAFILGSTEPHYTPSKVYQAVLAAKPILAVLHQQSSAANIIRDANVGMVLTFNGEKDMASILEKFSTIYKLFNDYRLIFETTSVNAAAFNLYSAKNVTSKLAIELNRVTK